MTEVQDIAVLAVPVADVPPALPTQQASGALAQSPQWRARLARLDAVILSLPQIHPGRHHHRAHDAVVIEAFIPKDSYVTGRIHKHRQVNVLLSGEISVLTEDGMVRASAPYIVESPPGTKRAAYTHEDSIWLTIVGIKDAETLSPDDIDNLLTCRTYEEYERYCAEQGNHECPSSSEAPPAQCLEVPSSPL